MSDNGYSVREIMIIVMAHAILSGLDDLQDAADKACTQPEALRHIIALTQDVAERLNCDLLEAATVLSAVSDAQADLKALIGATKMQPVSKMAH